MDDHNAGETHAQAAEPIFDMQALKEKALGLLVPALDDIEGLPQQRFDILIGAARTSGDREILDRALETAQAIPSPNAKASAIVDVLNEINYHISSGAA